jgi:serine/threonine protein kinase
MAGVERLMKRNPTKNEKRSFEEDRGGDPRDGDVVTPLSLERAMLARVAKHAGPAGFPRVHHFGRQRVFGRESRVLVMDLLGPSLEEMSWAVSAGGPLSRLTTLMIADQALARLAAVHRAGVVHRDVKPDNLLLGHPARGVGANRALHLVDFGLAALGPSLHGVDDASVDERGSEGSSRRTSGDENSATAPTNLDEPRGAMTNEETRHDDVSKIKETPVVLGTPAFSAAAADAGRPPTYADDLEALVFTVAYLRAGTFPWCPPSLRGDVAAVAARKADAAAADLATRDADREWMGALLAHARATEFGAPFDLALCRGIVRRAFAKASGGKRMRDTPFDWEQAGVTAAPAERKA